MALATPFYDEVHAWTYAPIAKTIYPAECQPEMLRYRMWLRQARRFVVDDDMIRLVAQGSMRLDKLELWSILARLPFDVCWFEVDHHEKMKVSHEMGVLQYPLDLTETSRQMGWLMVRDKPHPSRWFAIEFFKLDEDKLMPAAVAYVLDPEGTPSDPASAGAMGFPRISAEANLPENVEHALWGLRNDDGNLSAPPWSTSRVSAIMEPMMRHGYRRDQRAGDTSELDSALYTQIMETRGVLRFLVTLLAAINDVPVLYREVQPRRGHQTKHLRKIQYLSHSVVSIKAPKTKPVDWFTRQLDGAGHRKKRHEVRGHWRTLVNRKTRVVKGRTWIEPHERGDAALGYVRHTYHVEPSS